MFKITNQLFNLALASMIFAAPALAADGTALSGDSSSGQFKMSKRLAEGGPGAPGGERRKFGFSDDQLQKMSSLNNKFKDGIATQAVQLGSLHRQLKDVFTQPQVDRAKAVEIQSKINALKADLSIAKLNYKLDKMAILTPEQREKMRHRLLVSQAMGGERGGRHSKGNCGGGGGRGHGGGHKFRGGHSFRGQGGPGAQAPGAKIGPAGPSGADDSKPLVQS